MIKNKQFHCVCNKSTIHMIFNSVFEWLKYKNFSVVFSFSQMPLQMLLFWIVLQTEKRLFVTPWIQVSVKRHNTWTYLLADSFGCSSSFFPLWRDSPSLSDEHSTKLVEALKNKYFFVFLTHILSQTVLKERAESRRVGIKCKSSN